MNLLKLTITSLFLTTLGTSYLSTSLSNAVEFDQNKAAELLGTNKKPNPDSEQNAIKQGVMDSMTDKSNYAEPKVPENCKLKSFTMDGTHAYYTCDDFEVITTLTFPDNDVTAEKIQNELLKDSNCKLVKEESKLGQRLNCTQAENEVYKTYISTAKSGMIETITSKDSFNDISALEHLQNFSLAIYFFKLKIAKDYDQIDYIREILKDAHPAKNLDDLFNVTK